jgi:hypothetical protein
MISRLFFLCFSLVICSLICTFLLREKILSLERTKKNKFSFGSLLAYLYLFASREGTFARKNKEK